MLSIGKLTVPPRDTFIIKMLKDKVRMVRKESTIKFPKLTNKVNRQFIIRNC
jgi:hypothetical protein